MVDSVKNAISRMEAPKVQKAGGQASAKKAEQPRPAAGGQDSVQLKSTELAAATKDMSSVAPINMENVNRIKEAIREGKYPIDIDKVTDALMDAYRDLKSS